ESFIGLQGSIGISSAMVGAVEETFQCRKIVRREKPGALISRCQHEPIKRERVDLMSLVGDGLALCRGLFRQPPASPLADEILYVRLVAFEMEPGNYFWLIILQRGQGHKNVLRLEAHDLLQRLMRSGVFWNLR